MHRRAERQVRASYHISASPLSLDRADVRKMEATYRFHMLWASRPHTVGSLGVTHGCAGVREHPFRTLHDGALNKVYASKVLFRPGDVDTASRRH